MALILRTERFRRVILVVVRTGVHYLRGLAGYETLGFGCIVTGAAETTESSLGANGSSASGFVNGAS